MAKRRKLGKIFSKDVMVYGAGAGVGVIVPSVLRYYVEPTQGAQIPGTEALGVFGRWGTFIPIVTGAVALIAPALMKKAKQKNAKSFLTMYGVVALLQGILNGVWDSYPQGLRAGGRARAYGPAPVAMRPIRPVAQLRRSGLTPTGLPQTTIVA